MIQHLIDILIASLRSQLGLELSHSHIQLGYLGLILLNLLVVGQFFIMDLLLELSQKVLFSLVAVLENSLHVTAISLF